MRHRALLAFAAATLLAPAITALPTAGAAPCYSSDPAGVCPASVQRTVHLIVCDDSPCKGLVWIANREAADAGDFIRCATFIPIGTDRCLDDEFFDPLGFNADSTISNTVLVVLASQAWWHPGSGVPYAGFPSQVPFPRLGPWVRDWTPDSVEGAGGVPDRILRNLLP